MYLTSLKSRQTAFRIYGYVCYFNRWLGIGKRKNCALEPSKSDRATLVSGWWAVRYVGMRIEWEENHGREGVGSPGWIGLSL